MSFSIHNNKAGLIGIVGGPIHSDALYQVKISIVFGNPDVALTLYFPDGACCIQMPVSIIKYTVPVISFIF